MTYTPKYISWCAKIKIKDWCYDKVLERSKELTNRADETIATLIDEWAIFECAFIDKTSEGLFLLIFVKYKSEDQLDNAIKNSKHAIDQYHRQFKKDCRIEWKELEKVLDIENFDFM
jgi:hypothetical protein